MNLYNLLQTLQVPHFMTLRGGLTLFMFRRTGVNSKDRDAIGRLSTNRLWACSVSANYVSSYISQLQASVNHKTSYIPRQLRQQVLAKLFLLLSAASNNNNNNSNNNNTLLLCCPSLCSGQHVGLDMAQPRGD